MKTLALLVLCLSSFAFGQAPTVITFAPGACCQTVWQNGRASYIIQDANTTVAISGQYNYSAKLHAVSISIRQDGDIPLDINPALFHVIADDPEHHDLPYLDMDARAEKDRKHRARISTTLLLLSAGASGAAAAQPQTATVNNSNGTTSTITYTDPALQANANAQASENMRIAQENNRAHFEAQTSNLLRRTTSQKGLVVSGTVYFEGQKSMKPTKKGFTPLASIDIPINGTIYRFQ